MVVLTTPPMPPGVVHAGTWRYQPGHDHRPAIPAAVRRTVALRYGAVPGEETPAQCQYCGAPGSIYWPRLSSGKPGSWVQLLDLSFDHVISLTSGGCNYSPENYVVACRRCNSSKGTRTLAKWKGQAS